MSVYVIDANVLIQAHRAYYPLDIFTSFWDTLSKLAREEKIISIDKVKDEIYQNEDALKTWCVANLPDSFFKNSEETLPEYINIINWADNEFQNGRYNQTALDEFLQAEEADAWLVAFVKMEGNRVLVTQEKDDNKKGKVKIPTVCKAFHLKHVELITMLRGLKINI